ncbi:two-component sensor histidine kinase [Paenibacillus glycanilyticus]|uniref:histidine kinase n=1 Tax=Paenibacillus glycanilyticus TaxID=126569 RepID=A0ABQ6NKD4_9BACL|nr:HAMP domain-containing sensor histidine kinase [Paenibacillus glycanilyticus]GMK44627.1 two-component sensor histidine kinase [Paenibacillus glycanilyticus]
MKLWLKVFWCTFLLFEVLFNASSFYLIKHNFNQNLVREVDRGLADQHILSDQIEANWSYINNLNQLLNTAKDDAGDFLRRNAAKYLSSYNPGKVSVEIKDAGGQTVFTNYADTIAGQRPELEVKSPSDTKYIIRSVSHKSVMFVTGLVRLSGQDFKLTYIQDLTDIYEDKNEQIRNFIKINIGITLILAAGLYGLIRFLTRSIRMLAKSAQTIASGQYTHRVHVLSKDEVGLLSEQFNRMAEAIEEKVNALETSASNKERFIHYLTHELKTPLTSIIGYADLLRATTYNEEVFYKSLDYIYGEGKRLERLAFKLMDLILVENSQPRMTAEDIGQVLERTAEFMRPRLEKEEIHLSVTVEPLILPMEKDLIQIAATNLIDNSIKASKAGSSIVLHGYRTEDARYAIEVQDEGIGIPEQDIAKVLEPFFKGDPIRSHTNHGAGLGLAICSEIVRLHKGEIHIDSRLNKGTVVRIILPGSYN